MNLNQSQDVPRFSAASVARIKKALLRRNFPVQALKFVTFLAEDDPGHTELVKHLIQEVATRYPEAIPDIDDGLEYFLAIYPIPVWVTAYRRALSRRSDTVPVRLAA